MRKRFLQLIAIVQIWLFLAAACEGTGTVPGLGQRAVSVSIIYGSEKQEWLEPLVAEFNASKAKIQSGESIKVEATPMGSIESVHAIIEQSVQPTVWSPASSIYIPVANAEWRKSHNDDLVLENTKDLVLSPVVIAMWQPMAEALGYPQKSIGWEDISRLAVSEEGWAAYGYPEWGKFKFGHTHPEYSNSGIVAIIAQAYAAAGKQRSLKSEDLQNPQVRSFMADVQSSIIHYGTSTGFFANRMFERGPSYLSAAVLYENLIVTQESKRLNGESQQLPVVAIYPKEGTFWANHPYAILNAPWVTPQQKEAAQVFLNYLLDKPQQMRALQYGFRPSDPSISLTSPLDSQHGVDPQQPKTVLEVPSADVIYSIQSLWHEIKKPVDLVIVIDTSGSMAGKKIGAARSSLVQFINLLSDRDQLEVIAFSSQISTLTELSSLGEKREDITRRVSGIIEGGDTRLYDATIQAHQSLMEKGSDKHIRAIVILSDGQDTASDASLQEVLNQIGSKSEESESAIKIFTIAYGDDADEDVLKNIAESTGAKQYKSTPENINKIYAEIATFF
ncbi:MAG: VWA domain-containing protein [Anaerolineae bacterium]|nr:VWA domain-containing protein [Anaerolineae bacterium]